MRSALLDFQRFPGRHKVRQREPHVLFASLRDVLQLAAGRHAAPGGDVALRDAACLFVRSALIYPDADHYALLGLTRDTDIAAIKEHYRLLMRLAHPDFSGSGPGWPPDSAARLNLAYQALSSPERRAAYDAELAQPAGTKPSKATARPRVRHAGTGRAAPSRRRDPRAILKRLAATFGVFGSLALAAFLFLGGEELNSLVQQPISRAIQAPRAAEELPVPETLAKAPEPVDASFQLAQPTAQVRPTDAPSPPAAPAALAAPPVAATALVPTAPASASEAPEAKVMATAVLAIAPTPAPSLPPATAAEPAHAEPVITLAEAHPLLSRLLQQLETGGGERVLSVLDADARGGPAARELVRHYNSLVDGARPVKVSNVQFKAQPRDGRLVVTGNVRMSVGSQPAPQNRDLSVQAEFAMRGGAVVMTRLARAE